MLHPMDLIDYVEYYLTCLTLLSLKFFVPPFDILLWNIRQRIPTDLL